MKTKFLRSLALLAALAAPLSLSAHPGHGPADSISAGFAHPLSGLDHLLAMVAIGLWAALNAGKSRVAILGAFAASLLVGAWLGSHGLALPYVEPAIVVSVIALGLVVMGAIPVNALVAPLFAAACGLVHGSSHGAEMPVTASGYSYGAGFLGATTVLVGVGMIAGANLQRVSPKVSRALGGAIALAGCLLA